MKTDRRTFRQLGWTGDLLGTPENYETHPKRVKAPEPEHFKRIKAAIAAEARRHPGYAVGMRVNYPQRYVEFTYHPKAEAVPSWNNIQGRIGAIRNRMVKDGVDRIRKNLNL